MALGTRPEARFAPFFLQTPELTASRSELYALEGGSDPVRDLAGAEPEVVEQLLDLFRAGGRR